MKQHLTSLLLKLRRLNKKQALAMAAVSVLLISVISSAAIVPAVNRPSSDAQAGDHQRDLKAAVDSEDGEPQNGRDPASQIQNSLASAATKPSGPGQRTDTPAANVQGDHDHHAEHQTPSGTTSAGCIVGYGKPGEQCLPTPGEDKPVTCEYVHSKGFPHGIAVTGNDQFHLDKNHDKTACGHGD